MPLKQPCNDCPWRRVALKGWLGPLSAEEWAFLATTDEPILCHQVLTTTREECYGAAIFRANIAKLPRDLRIQRRPADKVTVFGTLAEFLEHHTLFPTRQQLYEIENLKKYPLCSCNPGWPRILKGIIVHTQACGLPREPAR